MRPKFSPSLMEQHTLFLIHYSFLITSFILNYSQTQTEEFSEALSNGTNCQTMNPDTQTMNTYTQTMNMENILK